MAGGDGSPVFLYNLFLHFMHVFCTVVYEESVLVATQTLVYPWVQIKGRRVRKQYPVCVCVCGVCVGVCVCVCVCVCV
jgi:hypothetical protein